MKLVPIHFLARPLLSAIALSACVCAQAAEKSSSADNMSQHQGGMMSSHRGMMDHCAACSEETQGQMRAMMDSLKAARDSNDPAKMRNAIDEALNTCNAMRSAMKECMESDGKMGDQKNSGHMMDHMNGHHGGDGMSSQGSSSDTKQ